MFEIKNELSVSRGLHGKLVDTLEALAYTIESESGGQCFDVPLAGRNYKQRRAQIQQAADSINARVMTKRVVVDDAVIIRVWKIENEKKQTSQ